MKILDASSLQDAMEQRAKHYDKLRDQFTSLKRAFQEMIDLDDFEGKGAEAIKGFYQGQIEVVEAWQRLFDRQIAFFEGVRGKLVDKDLGSNSRVETAFLEEDLVQKERQADEMITEQRRALENIFRDIDDLVPLHPFSRSQFDDLMMDASKKRTKTIEAVEEVDQELKDEYMSSEGEEAYAIQLFSALLGATKQGSSISPIQFDAEAYHQSDIYKLKGEAEEATISYLTYKQQEQEAREIAERPVVEKVWDGVKTFVGEFTGYYDYKRAVEGVDPVTGEKMSTAQRIAAGGMALAGFIPIVGWAGRAVKGGKGIYSAAKGINAAENAMSTYKSVQAFSTLEKTEMGIYGLLSANGLSEYTTGKDMFGNELTAEQRQASLTQSIFAGLPFVPGMAKEAGKLSQQALNSTVQIGKQGADVSRAFMDDLGRSLHTGPNVAFAGGVGDVSSYLKAESRADGVGKVSGDKESYLSMLSGGGAGSGTVEAKRLIPGTPGKVTGGSSTKLGKNMFEEMGLPKGAKRTPYQAQHIIPKEFRRHPVIEKIGMDMDDASNGFFLRVPDADISVTSRHKGYHAVYSNFVRKKLDEIDINQDISIIEKQIFELQQKLRYLQEKGLPLYMKDDYLENELKRIKVIGLEKYKLERMERKIETPVWKRGGGATVELWERWFNK